MVELEEEIAHRLSALKYTVQGAWRSGGLRARIACKVEGGDRPACPLVTDIPRQKDSRKFLAFPGGPLREDSRSLFLLQLSHE